MREHETHENIFHDKFHKKLATTILMRVAAGAPGPLALGELVLATQGNDCCLT